VEEMHNALPIPVSVACHRATSGQATHLLFVKNRAQIQ
jgi:hypothetical protein